MKKIPNSTIKDVPYPVELKIESGARIVNLSAAGMYVFFCGSGRTAYVTLKRSFFALDSTGSVYVWGGSSNISGVVQELILISHSGALDGTSYALDRDGYSEPAKQAKTPLKLDMPSPTRSIRLNHSRVSSKRLAHICQLWTVACYYAGRSASRLDLFKLGPPVQT